MRTRTNHHNSAHISRHRSPGVGHLPRRAKGGFTLLELIVVVVIIGLFAAMAVPSLLRRIDNNVVKSSAQNVAAMYRNARLRSMGRGSAVVVRYSGGQFTVLERLYGDGSWQEGCNNLPAPSCTDNDLTAWAATNTTPAGSMTNQLLTSLDFNGITVSAQAADKTTALSYVDVCFSPNGRSYSRISSGNRFAQMTEVPVIKIQRSLMERRILLLPNGAARVVSAGVQ